LNSNYACQWPSLLFSVNGEVDFGQNKNVFTTASIVIDNLVMNKTPLGTLNLILKAIKVSNLQ
jgi:hypothetical protein